MGEESKSQSAFHICIIGGGVVGLTGSILFRRQGFKVTVLERDAALHTIGAGIQLHPNAVRVLQDINVYEKIKSKSVIPPSMVLRAYKTGQVLHTQDFLEPAVKYGAPLLTLHRGHLCELLCEEAIANGVEIRYGITIDVPDIDLANGELKLSNPPEVFKADLFVGADGAQSVVREVLTGTKEKAIPHGKVVNRVLIEEKDIMERPRLRHLIEKSSINVWLGPECQAVTYVLHGTFNIALTWPYSVDPEDMFFGAQHVDLEDLKTQLSAWGPEVRELFSLAKSCLRWMLFEPIQVDEGTPWVDTAGRFCIVGDAAHRGLPYLGQGAAAGLESVAVLAYLLGKPTNREQVSDCLNIYQSLRKERMGHLNRATLKNGRIWQLPDGPLKDERDREFLNDIPSAGYPNLIADPFFQDWLWGFDASKVADDAWLAYQRGRKEKECGS
ncbi:FAD binding domain-containing protein [Hypomontagnella monticulosa]|nr:FAD binding domain-containing protein [Hypomontagnella monticulosa]